MSIKRIAKKVLELIVKQFGYDIVRITAPNLPLRKVAHAHYCGHEFLCFANTVVGDWVLSGRVWDQELYQIVGQALQRTRANAILDIGANIGASTVPLCSRYPDVTFHMFEPVPDFFDLLSRNCTYAKLKNVVLHNVALGTSGSRFEIQCGLGNAGRALLNDAPVESISANARALDGIIAMLPSIALIKIDVDGFEFDVLRGAAGLLERDQPDIFMEFDPALQERVGVSPDQVLEFLASYGLNHYIVYSNVGDRIGETENRSEVMALARQADYYIDLHIVGSRRR